MRLSSRILVLATALLSQYQLSLALVTIDTTGPGGNYLLTTTLTSASFKINSGVTAIDVQNVTLWRTFQGNLTAKDPVYLCQKAENENCVFKAQDGTHSNRHNTYDITILNLEAVAPNMTPSTVPQLLYFEVLYSENPDTSGRFGRRDVTQLTSNIFGLTTDAVGSAQYNSALQSLSQVLGKSPSAVSGDSKTDQGFGTGTASTTTPSIAGPTNHTTTATSSSLATDMPQTAGTPSGLSTGAIVGIAVGAGVVVSIIVGALAFFCIRRRQKTAAAKGAVGYGGAVGGGSRGRSGDALAEKEAANAAVSESGPNSPYAEEGLHRQHGIAVAAGAGAAGLIAAHHHHEHEREDPAVYAPYSDQPSGDVGPPPPPPTSTGEAAEAALPTARAQPPVPAHADPPTPIPAVPLTDTAMSGAYAHLVEDGMTPAEIARLEDEERQLDQAIERARGVTTE